MAAGLLERAPRPDDRRHTVVHLADPGRALLDRVTPAATRANARLLAGVAATDRAGLHRLLAALATEPDEERRAPGP